MLVVLKFNKRGGLEYVTLSFQILPFEKECETVPLSLSPLCEPTKHCQELANHWMLVIHQDCKMIKKS
jgi:hypothetical protein